jgi:molecular chaperone DnaK
MRIGIDIGTHTARAAYLDAGGRPCLVRLADGASALPALARQTMHGLEIGEEAALALVGNTETTVSGCTRLMGRAGAIPPALLERLPYAVREVGGEAACNLLYAEVRASEVFGRIARALADAAERDLGQPVEGVVLTVPASAEDRFRVQARAAVEACGLRVVRLINQPTAALLALPEPQAPRRRSAVADPPAQVVAVVSCGGGTTEVSLAERGPSGVRVLAVAGDALLGGDDIAWMVAEQLNARFRALAGVDVFAVGDSQVAAQGLRRSAEEALGRLAAVHEATLTLDHGGGFGRDLVTVMRRPDLDEWLRPALERISALCRRCLEQAGLRTRQVAQVVLTGDWATLPGLRETVAAALGRQAADIHTADATALAAYGAAIAASADAPLVWDVTPYPLGINCYYGESELFSPIIRANTPIPTPAAGASGAHTESYSTRFPDQTSVRLDVLQYRGPRSADPYGAERVRPEECEKLGSWEFNGLRPPSGRQASFTVTFAVDADGILQLVARESATGHTLTARVERGIAQHS